MRIGRNSSYFIFSLVTAILIFGSLPAFSADFEGKVTQKSFSTDLYSLSGFEAQGNNLKKTGDVLFSKSLDDLKKMASDFDEAVTTIFIKGKKYRIDTESGDQKVSMIYDNDSGQMITLQHKEKAAMITSMDQMGENMEKLMGNMGMAENEMGDDESGSADNFSLKATGKKQDINGYSCELFEGTDSDGAYMNLWLHEGDMNLYNSFYQMMAAFEKVDKKQMGMGGEEKFFSEHKGVPILTKTVDENMLNINEIMEIKKESVPKDKFEIPEGYKTMNMQEMFKQQMKMLQDQMNKNK